MLSNILSGSGQLDPSAVFKDKLEEKEVIEQIKIPIYTSFLE